MDIDIKQSLEVSDTLGIHKEAPKAGVAVDSIDLVLSAIDEATTVLVDSAPADISSYQSVEHPIDVLPA